MEFQWDFREVISSFTFEESNFHNFQMKIISGETIKLQNFYYEFMLWSCGVCVKVAAVYEISNLSNDWILYKRSTNWWQQSNIYAFVSWVDENVITAMVIESHSAGNLINLVWWLHTHRLGWKWTQCLAINQTNCFFQTYTKLRVVCFSPAKFEFCWTKVKQNEEQSNQFYGSKSWTFRNFFLSKYWRNLISIFVLLFTTITPNNFARTYVD